MFFTIFGFLVCIIAGNNPEIVSQALKSSVNHVGLVDAKTLVSQIIKLKGQNDNSIS